MTSVHTLMQKYPSIKNDKGHHNHHMYYLNAKLHDVKLTVMSATVRSMTFRSTMHTKQSNIAVNRQC